MNGEGCWLWQGGVNADGYGVIRIGNDIVYAHRLAWALSNGPLPAGVEVMHVCPVIPRDRRCCAPHHLSDGTHAENCAPGERHQPHAKPNGKRFGGPAKELAL